MNVSYLTVQDVEQLHEYAVETWGGLPGREPGKLEGALGLPMSGFSDYERFPTIHEKAAAYYYYLAIGHCFVDGNKRTSYLATFTFLDLNGYDLVADDEEVYTFTLSIAQNADKRLSFEGVVRWIEDHAFER